MDFFAVYIPIFLASFVICAFVSAYILVTSQIEKKEMDGKFMSSKYFWAMVIAVSIVFFIIDENQRERNAEIDKHLTDIQRGAGHVANMTAVSYLFDRIDSDLMDIEQAIDEINAILSN